MGTIQVYMNDDLRKKVHMQKLVRLIHVNAN